jgi:hypothetical protein
MDNMRAFFDRKTALVLIVSVLLGIGVGLLFGWVIAPVEWVDATPDVLREDLRVDHLRMIIDSYEVNLDAELALKRYNELDETKDATLEMVAQDPGEVDPSSIQKFQALVAVEGLDTAPPAEIPADEEPVGGEVVEGEVAPDATQDVAEPTPSAAEAASAGSTASKYLLPVCGATLLIGLLLAAAILIRRRVESSEAQDYDDYDMEAPESHEAQAVPAEEMPDWVSEPAPPLEQPLATFRTTYTIGDDLYDDSFSIESPASGDFLGECGVGIAEAIGIGEPKKVSAFEIWLFDKNDIQTVTKILLSNYTYNDVETRSRLSAKGDPVMAESGGVVTLETASLIVEARVVDITYGEGALPDESYFDRLTIELRAMPKPEL